MKIKIDIEGKLFIERKGKFKVQICPFTITEQYGRYCSNDCPLFGEPEDMQTSISTTTVDKKAKLGIKSLCLCHKTLIGQIIDERE